MWQGLVGWGSPLPTLSSSAEALPTWLLGYREAGRSVGPSVHHGGQVPGHHLGGRTVRPAVSIALGHG